MCWVMPPASPAATLALRIASSSEVLSWSTCPMTVTTGAAAPGLTGSAREQARAAHASQLLVAILDLDAGLASLTRAGHARELDELAGGRRAGDDRLGNGADDLLGGRQVGPRRESRTVAPGAGARGRLLRAHLDHAGP